MWDIISKLSPYAVAYAIPLLIVALGGLYSERSGIVNIGLEGLMLMGSFAAAIVIFYLYPSIGQWSILVGLVASMVASAVFSLLHGFASITLGADQVISGTAINMMASALTIFLARNITGSGNIRVTMGLPKFDVPLLSKIPVIGPLFFTSTYLSTWLVLLILAISWFVIYKTSFGLRLRSCGEHPHAANSAGVNVWRIRYIAVLLSGAFSGLGGGIMLVTFSGEFTGNVAGLGFLALASLIFGQWKPVGILLATLFFGFASTMANVSQVVPELSYIPGIILKTFPYVATLIALIIFSKSSHAPKASGEPFEQSKR